MKGLKNKAKAKYNTYKKKQMMKKAMAPVKTHSEIVNLPKTGKKVRVTTPNLKGLAEKEVAIESVIAPIGNLGLAYNEYNKNMNLAGTAKKMYTSGKKINKNILNRLRFRQEIANEKTQTELSAQLYEEPFGNSSNLDNNSPKMRAINQFLLEQNALHKNNPFYVKPSRESFKPHNLKGKDKERFNTLFNSYRQKQRNETRKQTSFNQTNRKQRVSLLKSRQPSTMASNYDPNFLMTPPPSPGYNNERKISFEPTSI